MVSSSGMVTMVFGEAVAMEVFGEAVAMSCGLGDATRTEVTQRGGDLTRRRPNERGLQGDDVFLDDEGDAEVAIVLATR